MQPTSLITRHLLIACCALGLMACSDDNNTNDDTKTYPALSAANPLKLSDVTVGVGVRHGESVVFVENVPDQFKRVANAYDDAMLHVQLYDELAPEFGEYTYYQAPSSVTARGPSVFFDTPRLGNGDQRAKDLVTELNDALTSTGASGFQTRSVTVDFWRMRRDWYVRWDGLLDKAENTKGKGNYGFGREEMYKDALTRVVNIAKETKPKYMILGDEMELLLASDSSAGLSVGEYSNFLSFFQEAAQKIREASPGTKVGAGINWDRFATRVALGYTTKQDVTQVDTADIDYAFQVAMLPILAHADIIALKSYREPGDAPYYAFLRRIPALYKVNLPVVFYSLGSPIENSAGAARQRNYLEDFQKWNAGVNVEAAFWGRLVNIDGTDTANQQVTGRCAALTEDESKGFDVPKSFCYDGLFDSLFQPRPVVNGLFNLTGKQ